MILASDVKEGMTISLDGKLYRILEVVRHAGSGQMHGFIELKLKDIRFGHLADKRVKQTDKFETGDKVRVDTEKVKYVDRVTGRRM